MGGGRSARAQTRCPGSSAGPGGTWKPLAVGRSCPPRRPAHLPLPSEPRRGTARGWGQNRAQGVTSSDLGAVLNWIETGENGIRGAAQPRAPGERWAALGGWEGTGHCLAIMSWSCPSPAWPPHARLAAGSGPGRWEDGCSLPGPGLSALSSLGSVGGLIWKQLKFCAEAAQAAGVERSQRPDRNQLVWIKSATDQWAGVPPGWRLRPRLRPHAHLAPHRSPRQEVSAGSPWAASLGPPHLQLRSAVGNWARAWTRVYNGWFGVSGGTVTVGPRGHPQLERAAEAAYGEGAAPRAHLWPRCVRTQGAAVGLRLRELPGPSEGPPTSTGSKGCGGHCATCPGA